MSTYYRNSHYCSECITSIEFELYQSSVKLYKVPLCVSCQEKFNGRSDNATPQARNLYMALKRRGIPAELEKYVGRLTTEIAIPDAMVNIELESGPNNLNSKQEALAEMKRTYFAFKKGYLTLKIPNSLVESNVDETAQFIFDFLNEDKTFRKAV